MRKRKINSKKQALDKKCSNLLKNLVKPSKGGSNRISSKENSQMVISPKGIVYQALKSIYGIESNESDLCKFEKIITTELSKLASKGKETNLFTSKFNTFFEMIVSSLNVMDGMMRILKDNGIEFDPKEYLDKLYGRKNDEDDNEER